MTPVDYFGSKTGITAAERAETIRRLASETSMPSDFVRPGHVYPLLAMEGGVLRRAGHTEAAVDLSVVGFKRLATGDRYSLIELVPEGGKFHQLRAQCTAAGFPIKGDVKYGARRGEKDRTIALHARSLTFGHPITGRSLAILAPPPASGLWSVLVSGIPGTT